MVEQAAETIGADATLSRVGALYHDIGKLLNPFFFIENQPPGNLNPHNDLDPETSAATIIRHIPDGVELGRKYRLPKQLLDFIAQHHGTTITRYQYTRALELAGMNKDAVDIDKFRYPGPRPSNREIALLMLADTSEARMRAEKPKDEDELHELIKSVVKDKLELGELDETQLTLKDLEDIIDSFTSTLRGVYHPRIQYPKSELDVQDQTSSISNPRWRFSTGSTQPGTHTDPTKKPDQYLYGSMITIQVKRAVKLPVEKSILTRGCPNHA